MRRLSTSALDGVRRAVEESPALLARMAEVAPSEEDVGGRASWLFVHRPPGWAEEVAALEAEVADAASARSALERLAVVENELRRVRAELADARQESVASAALEAALAEERRLRSAVEAELADVRGRVGAIERERDAAHRRASAADKALASARAAAPVEEVVLEAVAAGGAVDVDAVRRSVAGARAALVDAEAALREAATTLEAGAPPPIATKRRRGAPGGGGRAVRLPAPLPPGVLDDDPVAADHLVRLPACLLLVDGYNLSLRRWADLPLFEQRHRLVDALQALSARTGVEVEVVFDGEEDTGRGLQSTGGGRRGSVRTTFSADAVDADEVLVDLVDRTPMSRPVVVATDDRRVRREAGARGANVIGSTSLFVALGLGHER